MKTASMVASSPQSASMTSVPGCQPSAQTTRAPLARNPLAKLSTRSTATSRLGMGMPEEALPEAYERCERMTTALGANSMFSRSQSAPL